MTPQTDRRAVLAAAAALAAAGAAPPCAAASAPGLADFDFFPLEDVRSPDLVDSNCMRHGKRFNRLRAQKESPRSKIFLWSHSSSWKWRGSRNSIGRRRCACVR